MKKYIHNISGVEKLYLGTRIQDNEYFLIPALQDFKYAETIELISDITNDQVVMSFDGTTDLDKPNSLVFLQYKSEAEEIRFKDNSERSNGFIAKNAQEAIEEARATAPTVGQFFSTDFIGKGSAKNKWLGRSSSHVLTNKSPFVFTWKSQLVGITFSNSKKDAETDIELEAVAEAAGNSPTTQILKWELRDTRTARKTDFASPIIVEPGTKLAVFARDEGNDAKDVVVTTHWKILENNSEEVTEEWNGNIS